MSGSAHFQTQVAPVAGVPGAQTLRVVGRATIEEAKRFRQVVLDQLQRSEATKIVVELSNVEEMDTAGAAVLAEALKVAQARGRQVILCSPSDSVMRIFRLAGFESVLEHTCADAAETHRRLVGAGADR